MCYDEWNNKPPNFNRRIRHIYDMMFNIFYRRKIRLIRTAFRVRDNRRCAMAEKICKFISSCHPLNQFDPACFSSFFEKFIRRRQKMFIFNLLINIQIEKTLCTANSETGIKTKLAVCARQKTAVHIFRSIRFSDVFQRWRRRRRMFFFCILFSFFYSFVNALFLWRKKIYIMKCK